MKKFNQGGRPPLSEEEKRNKIIKISLTPDEHSFIEEHAARAGHKQIARFLHDVLISTVEKGSFTYLEVAKYNTDFTMQLIRLSNNINQLTHLLHQHPTDLELWQDVDSTLEHTKKIIALSAEIAVRGVKREAKIEAGERENGNA